MTPKRATVNQRGRIMWRALNRQLHRRSRQPQAGQKVVIMAEMQAPQDQPWGVKKGDPWRLVAWVETQTGVVPAETYISSCWVPAGWLDEHGEVA